MRNERKKGGRIGIRFLGLTKKKSDFEVNGRLEFRVGKKFEKRY